MKKHRTFAIILAFLLVLLLLGMHEFLLPLDTPALEELAPSDLAQSKQAYQARINTTQEVRILKYCGSYDGCIAILATTDDSFHTSAICNEIIAGVFSSYPDSNQIYACKDGKAYTLSEAYDAGLLSRADLVQIRNLYFRT